MHEDAKDPGGGRAGDRPLRRAGAGRGREAVCVSRGGRLDAGGPAAGVLADTLYDYINGGSDLYLKYDFEELQVVEYRKDAMSVSVEVYRHRDADHAFGIYSQERVPSAAFLALGAQGYYENAVCNFIQGGYYVKLSSDDTGADDREILLALRPTNLAGAAGAIRLAGRPVGVSGGGEAAELGEVHRQGFPRLRIPPRRVPRGLRAGRGRRTSSS